MSSENASKVMDNVIALYYIFLNSLPVGSCVLVMPLTLQVTICFVMVIALPQETTNLCI